jgi:YrbI family 3-deoxy-D-manno-octulosonate 8-phosphate phosphatase
MDQRTISCKSRKNIIGGEMIRDNLVLEKKIKLIKLLVVSCDGVLTDGSFYFNDQGDEIRVFSTRDIIGFKLLSDRAEVNSLLISSEKITDFVKLTSKLKLNDHYLTSDKQETVIDQLFQEFGVEPEQIAYVGSEIDDLHIMRRVGMSICPLDAAYEVRNTADYICNTCGGNGVIREIADFFSMAKTPVTMI